ncbi:MAG: hypothetical protein HZB98_07750 [Bacteroidia bacterium]|nr:hypothetical protein [Bacteroidia bacterium]
MKVTLFSLVLLSFNFILSAQDTIFVKNGQVIPAVIIEKNNTEIKYKKFGQPEPAAIYSVFTSDISSIHYSDGIIADYSQAGQFSGDDKPATAIEMAGTMKSIRWSFGVSVDYFNRNVNDDLLLFWQDKTGDRNATIGGNPVSYPILLRMNMVLGNSGRNRLGDELQLIITPVDAIYATDNNGANEIKLRNFYYNITLYYGHTLNHKQSLIGLIEPGLDLGFMSGYIKLNNTEYTISGNLGLGFHTAVGVDWIISKRFMASGRAGYRMMNTKESHESSTSSTGYSSFYVDPGASGELLKVSWNGPYFSFGLSWSLYSRLKTGGSN